MKWYDIICCNIVCYYIICCDVICYDGTYRYLIYYAHTQGYQMMKDGKLYGSIIPADVHSLRIKDVNLGETIKLQLLALTDHPVCIEIV